MHYQVWLNAGRYNGLPLVRRQCPLNRFSLLPISVLHSNAANSKFVHPKNNALCFNIFLLLIFETNNRFLASFDSSRDDL